jgi:hypothetical protein
MAVSYTKPDTELSTRPPDTCSALFWRQLLLLQPPQTQYALFQTPGRAMDTLQSFRIGPT